MAVVDGLQQLEDALAHEVALQACRTLFQDFKESFLDIFENQIELALALEGLFEDDDILVSESLEHADLTVGGLLDHFIFVDGLLELLDSNELAVFFVLGFVDDAVGALADDAYNFVLVHICFEA